jgi:hypothetical protein
VDAHPPVAAGRVPRGRCRIAGAREDPGRVHRAAQVPGRRRPGRAARRRRAAGDARRGDAASARSGRLRDRARHPPAAGPPVARARRAVRRRRAQRVHRRVPDPLARPPPGRRRADDGAPRGVVGVRRRRRPADGRRQALRAADGRPAAPRVGGDRRRSGIGGGGGCARRPVRRLVPTPPRPAGRDGGVAARPARVSVRLLRARGRGREGPDRRGVLPGAPRLVRVRGRSCGRRARRARGAGRGGAGRRDADDASHAGHVQRHAQHPLVGIRGRSHELRRRPSRHDRPRQAAADRVRSRLRQRLVPGPVQRAGRIARHRPRRRGDRRVRRAHVGRGGG